MKYKYKYLGRGIMTFYDLEKNPHTVTEENPVVILEDKLEIAGLERTEIRTEKPKKKKSGGKK